MRQNEPSFTAKPAEFLRPREAAAYLGISSSKLAKLRMAMNISMGPRFIKLGACVLYRRTDLDDWISANEHGGHCREAI